MKDDDTIALSARDIHKWFGQSHVLRGVSLDACQGDVISILGASGSGKSTLLRCLNLLETPDAGTLSVCGESIDLTPHHRAKLRRSDQRKMQWLRTELAMVFQSFHLWPHMTVLENLAAAPLLVQKRKRADVLDEAMTLLSKVGLSDKRNYYPAQLSGGQQQRVAIARALAMRPKALLFDEPTSALDPELVGEVLRVMRELAGEGRTMLVVTHELGFARDVSNRIVFLHQGKVEFDGPPDDAFRAGGTPRFQQFISSHRTPARF